MYVVDGNQRVEVVTVSGSLQAVSSDGRLLPIDAKRAAVLLHSKLRQDRDTALADLAQAQSGYEIESILHNTYESVSEVNKMLRAITANDRLNTFEPAAVQSGHVSEVVIMTPPTEPQPLSPRSPEPDVEVAMIPTRRKLSRGRRRALLTNEFDTLRDLG